ncbi:DNA polymerase III subunit delta [Phocaeicola paurosaccharolyticus]|uniref:DNA polymerase III subunit delta n=1 Tax=Phocaeicola paurosaccharolyticus TaxID=732242 RepID=UPI0004699F1A|nr:DNA polymerase III subunit delta [Phocaeicola paurosaccharolyticus]
MANEITYEDIIKGVRNHDYKPVYFLMGEESYYIDKIADFIGDTVLKKNEKEFNQIIAYGNDVDIATIISTAKRYPMMSDYQVVIIKEFQNVNNIDELSFYLQNPQPTTILVLCYKNGVIDKRKKLTADIQKVGILFDSKKMKDAQIPMFVSSYLKRKSIDIEPKAAELMAEFVGSDLSRLSSELEKLIISLSKNEKRITCDHIERNIGISKDYNNIELRNALIYKDVLKANKIVKYFNDNSKTNPIQLTLSMLFNFYSNLMLAYYAPVKNEQGIAQQLGLKFAWQAKDYLSAMNKYTGVKVMNIISDIRCCDASSKGIGGNSISNGDLLKELVFKILH